MDILKLVSNYDDKRHINIEKIKLLPLEGIEVNNDLKILFKYSRKDIEVLLGQGEKEENSIYYGDYELRIDLTESDEIEFIECLGGYEGKIKVFFDNKEIFKLNAYGLISLLKSKNNGNYNCEGEYAYSFAEISVGIHKELKEEDIRRAIEEAKILGEYENCKGSLENDLEKAKYFNTIGVGIKGYYKAR